MFYWRNLIILTLFTAISCSKKDKIDDKDAIPILTIEQNNLEIAPNFNKEILSLENLEKTDLFDIKSSHSGNITSALFLNDRKIKKIASRSYSKSKSDLPFFVTPLIIDNIIFLLDLSGNAIAYDNSNNKVIWRKNISDGNNVFNYLKGGINYHLGKIYITNGSSDLTALDALTGQIFWQKKFPSLLRSMPYISNNMLYVTTLDNKIYSLTLDTGSIIWQNSALDNLSSQFGNSGFNHRGMLLSYGDPNGNLTLFAGETGEVLWQHNIGEQKITIEHFNFRDIDAKPVLQDKKLYAISSNGYLGAFEYLSGIKIWERKISGRKTPWVTKDLIFIIDAQNRLIALSSKNGQTKWYKSLDSEIMPKAENKLFYGATVINGQVAVSCNCGKLSLFDYNSGALIKNYKIPKNINHFPVISEDKIYFVNNKSKIYQYGLKK